MKTKKLPEYLKMLSKIPESLINFVVCQQIELYELGLKMNAVTMLLILIVLIKHQPNFTIIFHIVNTTSMQQNNV